MPCGSESSRTPSCTEERETGSLTDRNTVSASRRKSKIRGQRPRIFVDEPLLTILIRAYYIIYKYSDTGNKKMKVLVSACLLGANCKYNGKNNFAPELLKLLGNAEVVPICPESLSGIGTPRPPVELKDGKAYDVNGKDVDKIYRHGVERALALIENEAIDFAVLQSRSPTCGVHEIYDGTFTGKLVEGRGIFARALADTGIPVYDASDIENIKRILAVTEE